MGRRVLTRPAVSVSGEEREQLTAWAAEGDARPRLAQRAAIVLALADGRRAPQVASELHLHLATVERWRSRFQVNRLDGIRRQAPRAVSDPERARQTARRILELSRRPAPGPTHRWTTRSLAKALSVSHMQVHRVWTSHRFDPRSAPPPPSDPTGRSRRMYLDIAGIFRSRSARLAVLECAERPPILGAISVREPTLAHAAISGGHATDPRRLFLTYMLPMFTALGAYPPGGDVGRTSPHDVLIFLRAVDYLVPAASDLWVIPEGLDAEARRALEGWKTRRPRFRVAPTAGSAGWAEQIRRCLTVLAPGGLHPDSFPRIEASHAAAARCLAQAGPRTAPFVWTPTFDTLRGWETQGVEPRPQPLLEAEFTGLVDTVFPFRPASPGTGPRTTLLPPGAPPPFGPVGPAGDGGHGSPRPAREKGASPAL